MTADLEEQYYQIYRYCYFRLRDRQAAEDVTQEAFLRYFEQEQSQAVERILPWLYTVARNLCMDEFRRQKHLPLEEAGERFLTETGGPAGVSPPAGAPAEELSPKRFPPERFSSGSAETESDIAARLDLQNALARLPQEEQELLLLRYVNEVPVHIICRITGLSRFAVYRRLRHALKQLRLLLEKESI